MNKKTNNPGFRLPDNFHPYRSLDAILGISQALRLLVTDDAFLESNLPDSTFHAATGLVEQLEHLVLDFHRYFCAIEDITSIRLPCNAADFERLSIFRNAVREPSVLYVVNR